MMTEYIDNLIASNGGIMLDIGCGSFKQPGYIGMDIRELPGVDIVHDVETFPWPLPDDCVHRAFASHLVEHINPHKFGFVNFMNEVWRVMRLGGEFAIACPHGSSQGFIQDPTHCNPINEATWSYFAPFSQRPDGSYVGLWNIYQPKPWHIKILTANPAGNMEVVLEKIEMDVKLDE